MQFSLLKYKYDEVESRLKYPETQKILPCFNNAIPGGRPYRTSLNEEYIGT